MSNLSKLMSKGNALAQQGDLSGARAILKKATLDHKRNAEPWTSLAAIHGMEGNFGEALRCARNAVRLAPNSLQGWVNLARAAHSCNEFAQAADAYQRARGLPGCPADITLELGLVLARLEKWADAEQALHEYCTQHPHHREATLTLGNALVSQKKIEKAINLLEAWYKKYPQDIPVLVQLGFIYLAAGRVEDARHVCDNVLATSPGEIRTLYLNGELLMFEGRYMEARDLYEDLITRKQSKPDAKLFLMAAEACRQMGDLDAATAHTRAAVKLTPENIAALAALSTRLLNTDLSEARTLMERAVSLDPNDPVALTLKGQVLEIEGDPQGAWDSIRTIIHTGAFGPTAASIAARVAPAVGKTDEMISVLEQCADNPEISVGDRRTLHFTLAQLCDKAGQYEQAFKYASIANRLKNAGFDHDAFKVDIERLKAVYSRATPRALPRSRINSELPVFIVGMPRSGTSLIEQILSCHSQVYACGETKDIGTLAAKIPYYPDGVRNLTQDKLDSIAEEHLKRLHQIAPAASRFTDKMPGNFMFLGIISQFFPGAHIINCRRDPRDICLSNFMIEFGTGLSYSYDIESLAHACQEYQLLMTHWKSVLPIPILDVRYEELITDPHGSVEQILTFCGLQWEDACLDFHKSTRQVATASYDQVRQPLYKSSVARWKHYEQQLEPVNRILRLHGDSYH